MFVLDAYLAHSLWTRDITELLNENYQASNDFHKWQLLRKNRKNIPKYLFRNLDKDMNLVEPKNKYRSRESFRRSQSSFISFQENTQNSSSDQNKFASSMMGMC